VATTIQMRLKSGLDRLCAVLAALWVTFVLLVIFTSSAPNSGYAYWFFHQGWAWTFLPPLGLWLVLSAVRWIAAGFGRS
jgi:hypothetical protein